MAVKKNKLERPKGEIQEIDSLEELRYIIRETFEILGRAQDKLYDEDIEEMWVLNFSKDERILRVKVKNFKIALQQALEFSAEALDTRTKMMSRVIKDLKRLGIIMATDVTTKAKNIYNEYIDFNDKGEPKTTNVMELSTASVNWLLEVPLTEKERKGEEDGEPNT